jgi:hypothetical protein
MLKHNHKFIYEVQESDIKDVPRQTAIVGIDGDVTLPQMLEAFEKYLFAAGFVPPENSYLDFVSKHE